MRISATFIAIILSVTTFGQSNTTVFLKWKIQPNEILTYKTVMEEIDTANFQDLSMDFDGLFNLLNDSTNSKTNDAKKFFSEINKSFNNNGLITNLVLNKKGFIDISMSMKEKSDKLSNDKDTADNVNKFTELMKTVTGNIMLRGAIFDNGSIQSFYVKNDQKNLIAMFFELPNRQIKIGDSWSLDINLVSMDQNFKCDTAFKKNNVTLIDLKKVGNETIAVIKYDILEYVLGDFNNPFAGSNKKTMMKMTYNAIAEFSIEKGRWSSYDGIMSLTASGVMTTNTTKKFALITH
jgi:hypothetical protein